MDMLVSGTKHRTQKFAQLLFDNRQKHFKGGMIKFSTKDVE
jgi:hypothetical protein